MNNSVVKRKATVRKIGDCKITNKPAPVKKMRRTEEEKEKSIWDDDESDSEDYESGKEEEDQDEGSEEEEEGEEGEEEEDSDVENHHHDNESFDDEDLALLSGKKQMYKTSRVPRPDSDGDDEAEEDEHDEGRKRNPVDQSDGEEELTDGRPCDEMEDEEDFDEDDNELLSDEEDMDSEDEFEDEEEEEEYEESDEEEGDHCASKEVVEAVVAERKIDTAFNLPPVSETLGKKLKFDVDSFTPRQCSVRPSYELPLQGCPSVEELHGADIPRVVMNPTELNDFLNIGKISGEIYFTSDALWDKATARLALFYYIGSRNTDNWECSPFITVAVEKGKETKIPFVLSIDATIYLRQKADDLLTFNKHSLIRTEKFAFVAVVVASDGEMKRSEEAVLDFGKEKYVPRRSFTNDSKEGTSKDDCINID